MIGLLSPQAAEKGHMDICSLLLQHSPALKAVRLGGNTERLVTYTGVSMAHLTPPGHSLLHLPPTRELVPKGD